MGRYARQAVADIPYHIINRGNNRQPIFFTDEDYLFFMDSLEVAKARYPCKIYSFVLMTNHVHLLLMPTDDSESPPNLRRAAKFSMSEPPLFFQLTPTFPSP